MGGGTVSKKPKKKQQERSVELCHCGKSMSLADAKFWGECQECRGWLPIHTASGHGNEVTRSEMKYHGGRFRNGEW